MCSPNNANCIISTKQKGEFSIAVTGIRNYMALTVSSGSDSFSVTLKDSSSLKTL